MPAFSLHPQSSVFFTVFICVSLVTSKARPAVNSYHFWCIYWLDRVEWQLGKQTHIHINIHAHNSFSVSFSSSFYLFHTWPHWHTHSRLALLSHLNGYHSLFLFLCTLFPLCIHKKSSHLSCSNTNDSLISSLAWHSLPARVITVYVLCGQTHMPVTTLIKWGAPEMKCCCTAMIY